MEISIGEVTEKLMGHGLSPDEAKSTAELLQDPWYYRIQLAPDVWTAPAERKEKRNNLGLTRALLSRTNLKGASVLDIGTMEGVVPVLAVAAGAAEVVAYDRLTRHRPRVDLVQRVYGRKFEHATGLSLLDFRKQRERHFDVVVFSGVFYHMLDPFGGLVLAASFVRPGGILIFESSAVVRDDCALFFNSRGRFYPGTNYFQPTPEVLDYFFRFIGLSAIDGEYIAQRSRGDRIIRIAIACRMGAKPIPTSDDAWMSQPFLLDFLEFGFNRRLRNADDLAQIEFAASDRGRAIDPETGTLHIPRFIVAYDEMKIPPEMRELSLSAASRVG